MEKEVIVLGEETREQPLLESYKTLRTNLLYVKDLTIIAVTSAMPNEGKTVTAFNLARSFAQMGKKTLLVDCDLRRSSLRHYLRVSDHSGGLSELLTKQVDDCIRETDINNLSVVLSGKTPPDSSELLSSSSFKETLKSFKEKFEYIVIDTPPAVVAADASIVGREADGVIMVVKSEESRKKVISRKKIELERSGSRIVGVVINGVKKKSVDYVYGYSKYGNYEKYGE